MDIEMLVRIIEMLAGTAVGFYGVKIYQVTKGGASMFAYFSIFAVLTTVIGFSDLALAIFGDTGIGYAIPKAIENTIIPALSVLAVMIGTGLARFARGE